MNKERKKASAPELIRQLGLFDSIMIIVGIVIGSGIFLTTGIMAKTIPSPGLILLAWIGGGLLTLAGALTYAELGASLPQAGGQYVYLREAYSPLIAFLFGWIFFLVYMTGGIAALALAFAEYFGRFFPLFSIQNIIFSTDFTLFTHTFHYSLSMGQLMGIAVIVFLSVVNYIGVGPGKTIQNLFTVLKIGILMLIVALGFTLGKGTSVELSFHPQGFHGLELIMGFGIALVAVSWAFDGWNNINFVAGEIKNPQKNLLWALILGTLSVTALYVLINYIYLYALPVEEIVGVVPIAEKAATALWGASAASLISAAVILSTFSSLNGSILAGPRVYYAMAKDGLFFHKVAQVHPRFHTPGFAIFIQAVWASILTVIGTFEQIFTFAMFVAILFWIAAVFSVFTLRKKFPHLPRPYKTWGYPVVPAVFIIASTGILLNTLIKKPVESLAGLGFTVLGIPVYHSWKKRKKNP